MEALNQFKSNLVKFFDELIEMFPHEGQFVVARIMVKDQLPITLIMDQFIKTVLPQREAIKKRDDRIFLESDALTFGLDPTQVGVFRRMWTTLAREDKAALWKWFDAFVFLADKYVKASTSA